MNRAIFALLAGLVCSFALATSGCAHRAQFGVTNSNRSYTFALAVVVRGDVPPTAAQWTLLKKSLAQQFAGRGWTLVEDMAKADKIVHVQFVPNPANPENSGRASIVSIEDNPARVVATSSTYASYAPSYWMQSTGMNPYYDGMFGYGYRGDYYYDDYYGFGGSYTRPVHRPRHDERPKPGDPRPPDVNHRPPNGDSHPPYADHPGHSRYRHPDAVDSAPPSSASSYDSHSYASDGPARSYSPDSGSSSSSPASFSAPPAPVSAPPDTGGTSSAGGGGGHSESGRRPNEN
jgi:hypothetical protein